jgi:uncharacterized protein YecT (DUF1311 family)
MMPMPGAEVMQSHQARWFRARVKPAFHRTFIAFCAGMMGLLPCEAGLPKRTTHPLVLKENECTKNAKNSMEIRACREQSANDWDLELNHIYGQILKHIELSEKSAKEEKNFDQAKFVKARKSLIESQRAWIAFREREKSFLLKYYDYESGSIWPLEYQNRVKEITVSRVRDLYRILESKDMSGDDSKNYSFDTPE